MKKRTLSGGFLPCSNGGRIFSCSETAGMYTNSNLYIPHNRDKT